MMSSNHNVCYILFQLTFCYILHCIILNVAFKNPIANNKITTKQYSFLSKFEGKKKQSKFC